MAGGFDTRIEVDDRLTAPLKRLRDAGGDMTRPFAEISEAVLGHTSDRYKREVGPDMVPWRRRKKDKEPGRPVLFKDGYLLGAIRRDSGGDFAAVGVEKIAAAARYAARHQFGGGGIPARPFLGIEERDLSAVEQIIFDHLSRSAGAPGGGGGGGFSGLSLDGSSGR